MPLQQTVVASGDLIVSSGMGEVEAAAVAQAVGGALEAAHEETSEQTSGHKHQLARSDRWNSPSGCERCATAGRRNEDPRVFSPARSCFGSAPAAKCSYLNANA